MSVTELHVREDDSDRAVARSTSGAEMHACENDPDRGIVYLPALDPLAVDVPGGGLVTSTVSAESIPPFDYEPWRDGLCWICAYADALRAGEAKAPPIGDRPIRPDQARQAARSILRSLTLVAKKKLSVADADRRRSADAEAPHYRRATEEEVRQIKMEDGARVALQEIARRAIEANALGAEPAVAVAMVAENAPVKDDVLELPPEAIGAGKKSGGKRRKKFSGEGGGQQSMF